MDDRLSLERSNPAAVDEYNAPKLLKFKVTKNDINIKYHALLFLIEILSNYK